MAPWRRLCSELPVEAHPIESRHCRDELGVQHLSSPAPPTADSCAAFGHSVTLKMRLPCCSASLLIRAAPWNLRKFCSFSIRLSWLAFLRKFRFALERHIFSLPVFKTCCNFSHLSTSLDTLLVGLWLVTGVVRCGIFNNYFLGERLPRLMFSLVLWSDLSRDSKNIAETIKKSPQWQTA